MIYLSILLPANYNALLIKQDFTIIQKCEHIGEGSTDCVTMQGDNKRSDPAADWSVVWAG